MCGRYASFLPPDAIRKLLRTLGPVPNVAPNWNVAPTQEAMVVRRHPESGERRLDVLRWGLVPSWTKDPAKAVKPINAKAETVASSTMFRQAFARRRALVPADLFYEWQKREDGTKQPFAIARADGRPLAFAGLWEGWKAPDGEVLRTFCILTTDANALMRPIHGRMPVILEEADWPVWLGEQEGDPAPLMRPASDGILRTWQVRPRVGNIRNNDAGLIEAI